MTINPHIGITSDGSLTLNQRAVDDDFLVDSRGNVHDGIITYNGPGGSTGTMISAADNEGRILVFKNTGLGDLTLDATGLGGFYTNVATDTLVIAAGSDAILLSTDDTWAAVVGGGGGGSITEIEGGIGIDVQDGSGPTVAISLATEIEAWSTEISGSNIDFLDSTINLDGASSISVSGKFGWGVRVAGGNFTIDGLGTFDNIIIYNGVGTETGTMVDAATNVGRQLVIKNSGSGNLTLDATGLGQFFDASLVNTLTLNVGDSVTIVSADGAWQVV